MQYCHFMTLSAKEQQRVRENVTWVLSGKARAKQKTNKKKQCGGFDGAEIESKDGKGAVMDVCRSIDAQMCSYSSTVNYVLTTLLSVETEAEKWVWTRMSARAKGSLAAKWIETQGLQKV